MDKQDVIGKIVGFLVGFFSKDQKVEINIDIPLDTPVPAPVPEPVVYKLTKDELLKGRDKQYPMDYTQIISDNLDRLLVPMNKARDAYGHPMVVNSGWRPPAINAATPGAAAHSKHMVGLAVDIADPNGDVRRWVLANLDLMQELCLYFEDWKWTPGWTHFQLGGPASGKRIFVPSTAAPTAPTAWDGKYDEKYDK